MYIIRIFWQINFLKKRTLSGADNRELDMIDTGKITIPEIATYYYIHIRNKRTQKMIIKYFLLNEI